jgi:hypothetical protein
MEKTVSLPAASLPAPWIVALINIGLSALSSYIATTKLSPGTQEVLQKFIADGEAAIALL